MWRDRLETFAVTIFFVVACGIFLVACGGNGNGMPENGNQMRITPPTSGSGCLTEEVEGVQSCTQLRHAGADCSAIPGGRRVQQCPTSSDAYRTITECAQATHSLFLYSNSLDVARERNDCEQAGHSFTIHKQPSGQQQLVEYGSIAYGIIAAVGSEGGRSTQLTIETGGTGTSRSAARDTALAECRAGCGTESACRSSCREVLWFRNACGASASGGGSDAGYLFTGVGWGASESEAEQKAIAACNRAASTKGGASQGKIIKNVLTSTSFVI